MSVTESFSAVLKRHQPYKMMEERAERRSYLWRTLEKDRTWKGGALEVPLETAEESSISFGSLPASTNIAEAEFKLPTVSTQPQAFGSMIFHEADLDRHDGDLEASYLAIGPKRTAKFIDRFAERISLMLLNDGSIATATLDGTAGGVLEVDHPERFTKGEEVYVDDDNSAAVQGFVRAIDRNAKTITLYDARTGGAAVNLSGYTVAQNAKVYLPGAQANGFTTLADLILPAAQGGSDTLYGLTKTDHMILQSYYQDGSGMTAATLLEDIFDAIYNHQTYTSGDATEIIISWGHWKNIIKDLESSRRFTISDKKFGMGFKSVMVEGPQSDVRITALQEQPTDKMWIVDWKALKFHGFNFFERKRHKNGEEYFLVRATTGYDYIVDIRFYGDLLSAIPAHLGAVYGVPASAAA